MDEDEDTHYPLTMPFVFFGHGDSVYILVVRGSVPGRSIAMRVTGMCGT